MLERYGMFNAWLRSRDHDFNVRAFQVVQQATKEPDPPAPRLKASPMPWH